MAGSDSLHLRTMRAARMHSVGEPLRIDEIEIPRPRPTDVLVQVKACGIVPNLGNVLTRLRERFPHLSLPKLPAIFGLDPAGVIVDKGSQVHGVNIGDRVYVNPGRYCGGCRQCRMGQTTSCRYYAFNGYLGFTKESQRMFEDYPYAGLGEYMTAPQYSLVTLPDNLPFEVAARWGYLGTGYKALRQARADMSTSLLINGISGTLGLGVALFALALGVPKILGTARNLDLLEKVRQIAPDRIHVHSLDDPTPIGEWARELTGGVGVDIVVDALGPGAPANSMLAGISALGRGGRHVNISAVQGEVPFNAHQVMDNDQSLIGSVWFTAAQGQEMADLAASNLVRLDVFEHEMFKLEQVNEALALIKTRNGGFSNYVICP